MLGSDVKMKLTLSLEELLSVLPDDDVYQDYELYQDAVDCILVNFLFPSNEQAPCGTMAEQKFIEWYFIQALIFLRYH